MKKNIVATITILFVFFVTLMPVLAVDESNINSNETPGVNGDTTGTIDDSGGSAATVNDENFYCEIFGSDVQFDKQIPKIIKTVILVMQIAAPLLLIVMGTIDFTKAVVSQKEDEMRRNQTVFIKRLIAAVLVFFVIAIVKFGISLISKNNGSSIISCMNCFIGNSDEGHC